MRPHTAVLLVVATACQPLAADADSGVTLPADSGTADAGEAGDAGTRPSFAHLDAWLKGRVDAGVLNGFAMLVFDDGDRELYRGEAGVCATAGTCPAGRPAYTVDLVTGVASSSKWVTSTVALATLERAVTGGRLASVQAGLDAPVSGVLPCASMAGRSGTVTLRQLLSFTDGLLPEHDCTSDRSTTLEACACAILTASHAVEVASPELGTPRGSAQPPGTVYKYGATHHAVAGAALEKLAGVGFETLFAQLVATPSGLQGRYLNGVNLAGSLRTSVADYAKLVRALYHDGKGSRSKVLLSPATVAEQEAPQAGASVRVLLSPQPGLEYGLNVWRWCYRPVELNDLFTFDAASVVEDPACTAIHQTGHAGKGGFVPFIDRKAKVYGVFAMREDSPGGDADYSAEERDVALRVRLYAAAAAAALSP
ncbi:MAG: beta-lactamase family protein [Myxococcaceae bacterium]|nr:beta-lactamase family protein [Myxococcaceae bacterium]